MSDYVTHSELDEAIAAVRADIVETERQLRGEFIAGLDKTESRIVKRMDGLDGHLTDQDRTLRNMALGIVGTIIGWALLRYGLHI